MLHAALRTSPTSPTLHRCVWNCISDKELDAIFLGPLVEAKGQNKRLEKEVGAAKNLVRWCLEGDPRKRPRSMQEILAHDFFSPLEGSAVGTLSLFTSSSSSAAQSASTRNAATRSDYGSLSGRQPRLSRVWKRDGHGKMHYHFFISHNQREASGDVGTLSHLFEARGIHCWRDMTQANLTEEGMREGVEDSDVFVLFLTNSMLSRP